jgi:hypothetical protein
MTGAANTAVPAKTEIGLVLQGGGALGAYEWGAITALFDVIDEAIGSGQDITLRVVTGYRSEPSTLPAWSGLPTAPTRATGSARCGAIS